MPKRLFVLVLLGLACGPLFAADVQLPGVDISFSGEEASNSQVATAVKIAVLLTVLSLAPALLIMMTAFTRIIMVLSMLRHALGMQDTPPNTVLISLALFLTMFTMMPVFEKINQRAYTPFEAGRISSETALKRGMEPIREFMIRQTREQDLLLMIEVSKAKLPTSVKEVKNEHLIPAFMLSELRTAFQIGFVIFLPFLLIDLVVAGILMSMGMMMVPPMMISLPIKILMFVLIDGWSLVTKSLLSSFH